MTSYRILDADGFDSFRVCANFDDGGFDKHGKMGSYAIVDGRPLCYSCAAPLIYPPRPRGCDRVVGSGDDRRRCRRKARYLFAGVAGQRSLPGAVPMRRAYCAQHSGPGLLSAGALPGWVDSVTDLLGGAK